MEPKIVYKQRSKHNDLKVKIMAYHRCSLQQEIWKEIELQHK